MQNNIRDLLTVVRHDPLAVLGFLLVGAFSVLFIHVQFKMREVGYATNPFFARPYDWGLPAKYLKIREQHGWSPWPVYLMWLCLALGVAALVGGLFLLPG